MEKIVPNDRAIEIADHLQSIGITNIEVGERKIIKRKLIDLIDPSSKRYAEIKDETIKVLDELDVSPDQEIEFEEFEIVFTENVTDMDMKQIFPDRSLNQKIKAYLLRSKTDTKDKIYGIFSGGGTIRPNTSLKSAFAPLIYQEAQNEGKNFSLVLIDHRGSDSDENKIKYCLRDRENDLAVVQFALVTGKIDKSYSDRSKIVHIANSTGGHVMSVSSRYLKPDSMLFSQPAAFSKQAELSPWGPEYSKVIRIPEGWRDSLAFDSVQEYLRRGGKLLVIGAQEDEVIPETVIKRYVGEIDKEYILRSVNTGGNQHLIGYMWIPVGHYLTSKDEITAITGSL